MQSKDAMILLEFLGITAKDCNNNDQTLKIVWEITNFIFYFENRLHYTCHKPPAKIDQRYSQLSLSKIFFFERREDSKDCNIFVIKCFKTRRKVPMGLVTVGAVTHWLLNRRRA